MKVITGLIIIHKQFSLSRPAERHFLRLAALFFRNCLFRFLLRANALCGTRFLHFCFGLSHLFCRLGEPETKDVGGLVHDRPLSGSFCLLVGPLGSNFNVVKAERELDLGLSLLSFSLLTLGRCLAQLAWGGCLGLESGFRFLRVDEGHNCIVCFK